MRGSTQAEQPHAPGDERRRRHRAFGTRAATVVRYAALALASLFVLAPVIWTLSTSLKTVQGITAYPPQWVPEPLTAEHYVTVMARTRIPRYLYNTSAVGLLTILVTLLVGTLAGYGTARFRFRGKETFLFMLLATSMIPGIAVLVALYLLASRVGLYDTHAALVLIYSAMQVPAITWVMQAFIEGIPKELDDAAMIDGCSRWQVLFRIILPLAQPGLAAAAILVFVEVWNEFLISYSLTISTDKRLLTTGLYFFVTAFGIEWGSLTASVILSFIPVLVLFLLLQQRFIEGLTKGSIRG